MLSVAILSVAMLSVIMLSVVMPPCLLGNGGVCISSRTHGFMSVATGNDHSLSKQKQKFKDKTIKSQFAGIHIKQMFFHVSFPTGGLYFKAFYGRN